jgi:hypothetical protein
MKIAVKCIHLQLDGGGMEHCSRFRRFGEEEIEKRERERCRESAKRISKSMAATDKFPPLSIAQ